MGFKIPRNSPILKLKNIAFNGTFWNNINSRILSFFLWGCRNCAKHFKSMISQYPSKAGLIFFILGTKGQRCREVSQLETWIQIQTCLNPNCVLLTLLPHCLSHYHHPLLRGHRTGSLLFICNYTCKGAHLNVSMTLWNEGYMFRIKSTGPVAGYELSSATY